MLRFAIKLLSNYYRFYNDLEALTFNKSSLISYKSTYIKFSLVHRGNYNLTYPLNKLELELLLFGFCHSIINNQHGEHDDLIDLCLSSIPWSVYIKINWNFWINQRYCFEKIFISCGGVKFQHVEFKRGISKANLWISMQKLKLGIWINYDVSNVLNMFRFQFRG